MKLLIPRYEDVFRIAADEFCRLWHAMTGEMPEVITEPVPGEDCVVHDEPLVWVGDKYPVSRYQECIACF